VLFAHLTIAADYTLSEVVLLLWT